MPKKSREYQLRETPLTKHDLNWIMPCILTLISLPVWIHIKYVNSDFNLDTEKGQARVEAINEISLVNQVINLWKEGKINFFLRDRLLKILEDKEIKQIRVQIFCKMVQAGKIVSQEHTVVITSTDKNDETVITLSDKGIEGPGNISIYGKSKLDVVLKNDLKKEIDFRVKGIPYLQAPKILPD